MPAFVRALNPLPHLRRRAVSRPLCTCALHHPQPPPAIAAATKFVVLSDLHVRRESVDVALQALQLAHDAAAERGAAVLFLGDFWHARGALPVDPLNRVLTHLSRWAVPLVMIPGNHDLITRAGTGVSLVPLATTLGAHRCMLLTKPSLALDALWLPYTHDAAALRDALADAAALDVPPRAVFCHVEVAGARLAGAVVSRGRVAADDFPHRARVYSGHIHRPHCVGGVRYVGSPYQVSAAEAGQRKALLVLDRAQGWAEVDSVPLDIGPRHYAIDFAAPYAMPDLRAGDRVSVAGVHGGGGRDFVATLRDRDVRVEVVDRADAPGQGGAAGAASAGDRVEPRISPGGVSNAGLFRRYSEIKNLGAGVCEAGLELLSEVGSRVSESSSGKDVVVQWESVRLQGFGTFLDAVEYPLSDRGLVLVTGCDCDADGALSGRTNATGKTTLVMAALWAWTGRTDPRPDGSVEKGVSLEMVHDEAKACEVSVCARLLGHRVHAEVAEMMTPEERLNAGLELEESRLLARSLDVQVTRSSTRNGSAKTRSSYRQALCLKVNGVDLSCLDLRETQHRIDRLVDGTLLPHTTFFGQHMGAGRGLLDVTDRTLKEHLALIFPLDVWVEARKICRAKLAALHEAQVSAEAALQAAKAVVERLEEAQRTSRRQVSDFEEERRARVEALECRLRTAIASRCDVLTDSVIVSDSLAPGCTPGELERVVQDLRAAVRAAELPKHDELDRRVAAAAAELARCTAQVAADAELCERTEGLLRRAREWEAERDTILDGLRLQKQGVEAELSGLGDARDLEQSWATCVAELRECDAKLQQLVDLNVQGADHASEDGVPHQFGDQLLSVASARRRAGRVRDERVRLQTTLQDIRVRLAQSEEYLTKVSVTGPAPSLHTASSPSLSAQWDSDEMARQLSCDKCLRPFDGEQFATARNRLQGEARVAEGAVSEVDKRVDLEQRALDEAVRVLTDRIDVEKKRIVEKKRTVGAELSRVRGVRDRRGELSRQAEGVDIRIGRKRRERNVYLEQLHSLGLLDDGVNGRAVVDVPRLSTEIRAALLRRVDAAAAARARAAQTHATVMDEVRRKEHRLAEAQRRRQALRHELDDMLRLQAECAALDGEKAAALAEGNPFGESLRVLDAELSRESELMDARTREFRKLLDGADTLKAVDVAFGPRGVPSFLLEEGLMWLESASDRYLRKLSDGELSLRIRAFSDYKSARADENKEVISKRVLVRGKHGSDTVRERALRQLSGGQRRRCSLAFALAFADLARERAGFESSMVVFDEVLQSLDLDGRNRVAKLLPEFVGGGRGGRDSVFVVAQDEAPEVSGLATGGIDIVERQAERSSVIVDGKIGGEGLQ